MKSWKHGNQFVTHQQWTKEMQKSDWLQFVEDPESSAVITSLLTEFLWSLEIEVLW